jgi:hypothetical protein
MQICPYRPVSFHSVNSRPEKSARKPLKSSQTDAGHSPKNCEKGRSILQKVHYDQAERVLLAVYISGLMGNSGQ